LARNDGVERVLQIKFAELAVGDEPLDVAIVDKAVVDHFVLCIQDEHLRRHLRAQGVGSPKLLVLENRKAEGMFTGLGCDLSRIIVAGAEADERNTLALVVACQARQELRIAGRYRTFKRQEDDDRCPGARQIVPDQDLVTLNAEGTLQKRFKGMP